MEFWQTLLGGILGGGVFGFIQFLITRHDTKKGKDNKVIQAIEKINDHLTELDERMAKERADDSRRNIIIFDDEIRRKLGHSEESFNQVNEDITHYTEYCRSHANYQNSKAVAAIQNIRETYRQVKKDDAFI